jgi:Right handed beta helix region
MGKGIQSIRTLILAALSTVTVLISGVLSPSTATAATYYAAITGKDSNSCTAAQNSSTPKQHIMGAGGALACLHAGDTLYLRGGTYNESIGSNDQYIPAGTSWTNPVMIASYSNEIAQVLSLSVQGTAQYIIFKNLIVDSGKTLGDQIYIGFGGGYARFLNVECRNSLGSACVQWPPHGIGHNEYIGGKVHDSGTLANNDHGFYLGSSYNLIDGVEIYSNCCFGIQIYTGDSHVATSNTIRNNVIHNNDTCGSGRGGILVGNAADTLVYNNIVYNEEEAINAYKSSSNTQIYNNTLYNNSTFGIGVQDSSVTGAKIKNNIVYQGSGIYDSGSGTIISNNLLTDPKFINPSAHNFSLQAGSSAIDRGVAISAVPNDFGGMPRPQGAGYDIGAYEYHTSSPASLPTPTNFRLVSQ